MSFHVFWIPQADQQLQDLLQTAEDAGSLLKSVKEINKALSTFPKIFGESRTEDVRVAFVHPLALLFQIVAESDNVIVLAIWRIDPK